MIISLAQEHHVIEYLNKRYGVNYSGKLLGLPLFTDGKNYYLGGYKNFYSIFFDEQNDFDTRQVVFEAKKKYPNIKFNFSSSNIKKSIMSNFVLDIRKISDIEKRMNFYSKKVRNQVKKSYDNSLETGGLSVPDDFYTLYAKSMDRLGSPPKTRDWFSEQEKFLSKHIICFSLYDGKKLVGCNYCILGKNIIHLMFNVSNSSYWHYNINNRLYDELIKWSILNKYEFIDFGPSLSNDKEHNHFKEGFGAQKMNFFDDQNLFISLRRRLFWSVKKFLRN